MGDQGTPKIVCGSPSRDVCSRSMARSSHSPLPEYPGAGRAIIEPSSTRAKGIRLPKRAVLCFFGDVLKLLEKRKAITVVHHLKSEMGLHPIYAFGQGKDRIAIYHPGLGAPMVAAGLEEIISYGVTRVIACGGAGVLRRDLTPGSVVIPTSALRDEGTSHHYQPRRRCNQPHSDGVKAIKLACKHHGTPFVTGTTWTTDAFYRETPAKIASRKREGCITVEMEAAAFFAVARFRKIKFAQVLYAGDDISGREWDTRRGSQHPSTREKLLQLAIDAVRLMK